jgi:ubiquinone/menaquinone biosynthesis C-methylase UbiE
VEGLIRPRILETASGHGQLAIALERALATRGISAMVTGSDLAPELVALSQRNAAAAGSRARFRRLDATALEIPDDSQDLVLNALSMHHLPFGMVVKALAEMRRVAPRAVVFDLLRAPVFLAPATIVMFALSQSLDCTHDGIISLRKAWGADEWRLAAELAGWSSMSIGVMLPSFVFVRLDR